MEWVSVKDRLPGKDCLAPVSDGRHVTLADWTRGDGRLTGREEGAFGITDGTITRLMPPPAPPAREPRES